MFSTNTSFISGTPKPLPYQYPDGTWDFYIEHNPNIDKHGRFPWIIPYKGKKMKVRPPGYSQAYPKTTMQVSDGHLFYRFCTSCLTWKIYPGEFNKRTKKALIRECLVCRNSSRKKCRRKYKMKAIALKTELKQREFAQLYVAFSGDGKRVLEKMNIPWDSRTVSMWLANEEVAGYIREEQANKNSHLFITGLDIVAEAWQIVKDPAVTVKDKAPYFKLLAEATGLTGKIREISNKAGNTRNTYNVQVTQYGDVKNKPLPVIEANV